MKRLFKHVGWEDVDSVHFGKDAEGMDVKWWGTTSGDFVLFDESADTVEFEDITLSLMDDTVLSLGDSDDITFDWTASGGIDCVPAATGSAFRWGADSYLLNHTFKGTITVGKTDTGHDVKFWGASAGAYVEWDESADRLNIVTTSSRAISGEEYAISLTHGGTLSSGDSMVGINIATTASGANASWVAGIFSKVIEGSTKVVDGYMAAGEFEYQTSCDTASAAYCLALQWGNSSANHPAQAAYITLRDWGTTKCQAFLEIGAEHTAGSDGNLTKLWSANVATASTHTIRITHGGTAYFIMCADANLA